MSKEKRRPPVHEVITIRLGESKLFIGEVASLAKIYADGSKVPSSGIQPLLDEFERLRALRYTGPTSMLLDSAIAELQVQLKETEGAKDKDAEAIPGAAEYIKFILKKPEKEKT